MTTSVTRSRFFLPWPAWVIAGLLLFRLFSLGLYPLMDTSEARYGEIARVMVQTGNWVTPQETPGTPFWAKPPLSTWLSAASIQTFGVNEFALRLPAILCALLVLAMVWSWARQLQASLVAHRSGLAATLLGSGVGFFAAAGTVMTDPSLVVCICAMQWCFHQAVIRHQRDRRWGLGFFLAAGLGMLAKGPVILMYVGAPIFLWALFFREFPALWRRLPWVLGTALMLAICLPWYVMAEQRTPGFVSYFLIGEHVMRFIRPGWGGDLYGTAHAEPLGTIWVYFAGAIGAQMLLLPVLAFRLLSRRHPVWSSEHGPTERREQGYLWLNALVPLVFFTVAGNIIWTYVLPALPAFSVGLAWLWQRGRATNPQPDRWVGAVVLGNAILLVLAFTVWVPKHVRQHSSADLVAQLSQQGLADAGPVYYLGRKAPASLRFYTRGQARVVSAPEALMPVLQSGKPVVLAIASDAETSTREHLRGMLPALVFQVAARNTDLVLLVIHGPGA